MYDDWYEPSEFDVMVEEFKEELRNSVRQEIRNEIEKLKQENERLQDIKARWDEKVAELNKAKAGYENAKLNAVKEAKKMCLKELFSDNIGPAWSPEYEYVYIREKCDKCDKDGYIHFKSPQGRDCKELCDCRKKRIVYYPKEVSICQIITHGRPPKYEPYRLVFDVSRDDDDDEFRATTNLYDGEPFEKTDQWRIVFADKEKCQEYCDWKEEQEKRRQR